MNLARISIERPTLLAVIFSILILLGGLSYSFLNYELVPKFTPPVITVVTLYPGASAETVENEVSMVIEDALSSLQYVNVIKATSMENFSLIRMELKSGTDVDEVLREANRKVMANVADLPSDARAPIISRFDFDDLPIARIGVFADQEEADLTRFTKETLIPELASVGGVAQLNLLGKAEDQLEINVDPTKARLHGVSILQVLQAIRSSNLNIPSGSVESDQVQQSIRFQGKFTQPEEILDLVVFENMRLGKKVTVRDIGRVEILRKPKSVISRINGTPALTIDVQKQANANAVQIVDELREKLVLLEQQYQDQNLSLNIIQNSADFTRQAADSVMEDLVIAIILVSLVMLLFLHSIRNSLIVFISIPTSIISTFIVMYALGYSLNLLSLLGLSLAIGILVDDSIVVLENIYRHLEMGKSRIIAAYQGRIEIGFTALSITLIDVVVFLPIIFAEGMIAGLFRQFSVVIVTSTLLSLFVSFTLVPFVASRIGKVEKLTDQTLAGRFILKIESAIDDMIDWVVNLLNWAFDHKRWVFLSAILLLGLSISLIPLGYIGIEFTKAGDRSEIAIEVELPIGTPVSKTDQITKEIEGYLLAIPMVTDVFTTVGVSKMGSINTNADNLAQFAIRLTDKSERALTTSQLGRLIKYNLEERYAGVRIKPQEINILGLRDDDAVEVTILSNDQDELTRYHDKAFEILKKVSGTVEETTSHPVKNEELSIIIDRKKAQLLGINTAQAAMTVRMAINGQDAGNLEMEDRNLNIIIQADASFRQHLSEIQHFTVLNNIGQPVSISEFSSLVTTQASKILERTNRSRSVTVKSQVIGKPAGSINSDFKSNLASIEQPESVSLLFGGQSKRTTDGMTTMIVAFTISIFLVYLILVALYNSFVYPFVVLFSIPLAIIGALLALALAQQALSIFSILGLIMLVGLVGKNAILVVDFANMLRRKGVELREALLKATRLRFRPILMTNLTMVIGLLPIALAQGAGAEWKNGLAWVLIGGLSSSMVLTMIIVPLVYYIMEKGLYRVGIDPHKPGVKVEIDN